MMVSKKQKFAVKFIIETMRIPFKGDIDNIKDVTRFLDEYFDDAKLLKKQLESIDEYYENLEIENMHYDEAYGADNTF